MMWSCNEASKQKEQARETRLSLIEKVKSYWPDLVINDSNLQKPTQRFVYTFYSRFYSEYEKTLFEIKTNVLKFETEQVFDSNIYIEEFSLGIKLRKISKHLNEAMPFYLNDIFEPQPRRTVLFFSVFMNLLIYMKTDTVYVDEICEVVEKAENFEKLYFKKQELLEEIKNMNLLSIKLQGNIEKLTQTIESMSNEYGAILMQKAEKEYDYQNDMKVKNRLKEHLESFDEYLVRLRVESNALQEQLVEETDVEAMKNKISSLEKELEIIDDDRSSIVSCLGEQEENIKHYNKCLKLLQHLEFKSHLLHYLSTSIENVVNKNQEIEKLKEKTNNKINEVSELHQKQKFVKEKIIFSVEKLSDLKTKIENNIKELTLHYNTLSEVIQNEQNECKNYENDIVEIENMILVVKDDKSLLESEFKVEYCKLIEKQAEIYNSFNNALITIDNYQQRNFDG